MPRFTGRNNSNTSYFVRPLAHIPESKGIGIAPNSTFDFFSGDQGSADIETQLGTFSGVSFTKTDAAVSAKLLLVSAPAAAGATAVHAAIAATVAAGVITTGLTNPSPPRNLSLVFALNWDGGNITVTGTDQFDNPVTEAFTGASNVTRTGVKIFKTVTSLTKSATGVTANTVTVGTGVKLGVQQNILDTNALLWTDGTIEAVTMDATVDAFTPTTAPNGTHNYQLLVNV